MTMTKRLSASVRACRPRLSNERGANEHIGAYRTAMTLYDDDHIKIYKKLTMIRRIDTAPHGRQEQEYRSRAGHGTGTSCGAWVVGGQAGTQLMMTHAGTITGQTGYLMMFIIVHSYPHSSFLMMIHDNII